MKWVASHVVALIVGFLVPDLFTLWWLVRRMYPGRARQRQARLSQQAWVARMFFENRLRMIKVKNGKIIVVK